MLTQPPRSVADIEGFVSLLKAACDDPQINSTLERLLAMPDAQRQGVVHAWVTDLPSQRVRINNDRGSHV